MFNAFLNRLTRRRTYDANETRKVAINDHQANNAYPNNRISNTKYTIITFLPKNLLEQFGRFMNIYFLMIACLQLVSVLAPVNPVTTWVPLGFIFALSALKEGVDDYYRYKADQTANTRKYWILSPTANGKVEVEAQDIRVGDLLYLRENDEVPSDIVLLKTADAESNGAYIQTTNLDGETDLKPRNAVRATAQMTEEELYNLRGTIECALPNAEVYKFDSRMQLQPTPQMIAARLTNIQDDAPPTLDDEVAHHDPLRSSAPDGSRGTDQGHNANMTHRRSRSSGRNLTIAYDNDLPSLAPNTLNADLSPQNYGMPRRTISGALSLSAPTHRRARSLGGSAVNPAGFDQSSPFYIPEHNPQNGKNIEEMELNGEVAISLDPSHTAWQATTIRNVAWVVGVVVYTGNQTKVGMNKSVPPSKWTKIDSIINSATISVFALQIILTILLGTTGDFWLVYNAPRHWYLFETAHMPWVQWLVIPLRFLLLMSMMIPISLKVTLDGVKYVYALLINWDLDMVDEATGTPANCNSSALAEDLGQIEYIFSDKTGTLTENIMVFAQCSIDHIIYDGSRPGEVDPSTLQESETEDSESKDSADKTDSADADKAKPKKKKTPKRFTAANDPKLKSLLTKGDPLAYDFCRILALCNTAMPSQHDDGYVVWKCASPDEEALVVAAAELGFTLKESRGDELLLEIDPSGRSYSEKKDLAERVAAGEEVADSKAKGDGHKKRKSNGGNESNKNTVSAEANSPSKSQPASATAPSSKKKRVRIALEDADIVEVQEEEAEEDDDGPASERYTVLHILEFTSDRKRMSVLLRNHRTSQLVLLMKGADDKVLERLAPKQHKKDITADVELFAQLGLRTLCLAQRIVSESEYTRWSLQLNKAATALKDREAKLEEAYAAIEIDFQFVGITAIEDKLQQGVPETIELLRRAGIKVWMLTGDKLATALQIATSCNLINPTSVLAGEVFTIEGKTFDTALASLNATIAKVLPLTRGMGATNTASSTGVRLNSYFDQPQAYKYQHLALKTAAHVTLDDEVVGIERTLTEDPESSILDSSHSPLMRGTRSAMSSPGPVRHTSHDAAIRDIKAALDDPDDPTSSMSSVTSTAVKLKTRKPTPDVEMTGGSKSSVAFTSDDEPDRTDDDTDFDEDSQPPSSDKKRPISPRALPAVDEEPDFQLEEDENFVEFQNQQYFAQYHDQQFHQPSVNPNTRLMPHRTIAGVAVGAGGKRELSLVVEGSTLTHLLRPACKARFLQLALQAHTVICCRVTPQQKAQVVELVKHGARGVAGGGVQQRTTLAIGDGGNDVSMIQAASVGVGLVGREGLQASRASDFSLAKFRFLAKLILVHGRWSYRRTAFVAHYCLHKSIFLAFMQIFYAFFSGFAGTSFFDSFALASYNLAFAGLPIFFYSLDKDINEQNLLLNPQLYHETQSGRFINRFTFLYWFVRSFAQSALVFFVVIMLSHNHVGTGFPSDGQSISTMAYSAVVIVQSFTVFLESNQLTFINHIIIWGTLVFYFIVTAALDGILPSYRGVILRNVYSDPIYWFGVILAASCAILPIVALRYIMINFFPTRSQLVQRMEALDAAEYEEFAQNEQRRRVARARYIQESHEVASQLRSKSTALLRSSVYTNISEQSNQASGRQRFKWNGKNKHPSTLHRTTPATPDAVSDDEFGEGRSAGSRSPDSPKIRHEDDDYENINRLLPPLTPDIVDPYAMQHSGTSKHSGARDDASKPGNGRTRSSSDEKRVHDYGYGPSIPVRPKRPSDDRSAHKNPSTSEKYGRPIPGPSGSTDSSMSSASVPNYKPNFSASEPFLPPFEVPSNSQSHKRGSQTRPSAPGVTPPPRRGSGIPGAHSSAGSFGTSHSSSNIYGPNPAKEKVSPIPSLSQKPQFTIDAGHAGMLQVVPLHMIGRKPAASSSVVIPRPYDDDVGPTEEQGGQLSNSLASLPRPSGDSRTSPSKRARSKSLTPKGVGSPPSSSVITPIAPSPSSSNTSDSPSSPKLSGASAKLHKLVPPSPQGISPPPAEMREKTPSSSSSPSPEPSTSGGSSSPGRSSTSTPSSNDSASPRRSGSPAKS